MKAIVSILSNAMLNGENYGFLINGELHVAPTLYDKIYIKDEIDNNLLMSLDVIDVDEMAYLEKLNEMLVFAGQQVKVFENGMYRGDGTITRYPFEMHFEYAEVTMHFPVKRETMVCEIINLEPLITIN